MPDAHPLVNSYVKSAYGVTDTPDAVPELISQRRRWLNGSFFAAIHATVKFGYLYRSSHSFVRKAWLHVELIYQIYSQLFAWFSLANYYIAFVSPQAGGHEIKIIGPPTRPHRTALSPKRLPPYVQSILTNSLQDSSFNLPWTKYVNTTLHYIYLGLLVMCFLLAMGNRPQGSKKMFTFAMVAFAIITIWMTVSEAASKSARIVRASKREAQS